MQVLFECLEQVRNGKNIVFSLGMRGTSSLGNESKVELTCSEQGIYGYTVFYMNEVGNSGWAILD